MKPDLRKRAAVAGATVSPAFGGAASVDLAGDGLRHEYQRDNLSTMLFVAALIHGVLILGVTFKAIEPFAREQSADSMEVVLLTRDYEKTPDISDAEYLAQQNLAGTGNTTEDVATQVSYGQDSQPKQPGPEQQGEEARRETAAPIDSPEHLLYARTPDAGVIAVDKQEANIEQQVATGMLGESNSVEILATPADATLLKSLKPRQLLVSANTRESRIAAYLDSWKRRVERVGTMNFPRNALDEGAPGNPVLEVSIARDGSLASTSVLIESGNTALDMAAINILKMAAPFDPFPEFLVNEYDVLKFSYEWRFSNQSVGRMTVPQANN